ncbi:type IV pili methyl-accepting chemotaxis transducer N-terminal domain-containing protein [Glaciecola sp. XM2]|jgi:hypothetical protein|uniref:type IV pili methyl-accepting chemotaxis transducer N-terminal domain-containing protein n=1 Tax=Glaciecola sp. XM2 TaxID=1914931 RepID=UPI001BDE4A0B|nr:type IV pili methyl-accepting chemotaxis transducer N-terminal domain-containing protein [Glaciecola sp. XM2]MBT1451805.1 type IV pili methyl-accepting chemotaxis transducer N-terminal domain-containing protein [Glaciecola sp. XM2]
MKLTVTKSITRTFTICCLFLTLIFVPNSTVFAQTAEELGTVINLSGKQRMLTQKMSKEIMLIALDVDKAQNLKNLEATSTLFDKTLKGLRNGDADLNLPATESSRISRQLDRVDDLWATFYPTVQAIIANGTVMPEQISLMAEQNGPLLAQMNKVVGAYEKEAERGGLQAAPGLAATINLSGKQRMLTQKMSKEFLLVANGHDVANNRLNLLETFSLFERTLTGLKLGDDTLGLPPTTDADILAQLNTVSDLWAQAKPIFEASSAADSSIDADQIASVAQINIPLLKEMNKAVGMYEKLAK